MLVIRDWSNTYTTPTLYSRTRKKLKTKQILIDPTSALYFFTLLDSFNYSDSSICKTETIYWSLFAKVNQVIVVRYLRVNFRKYFLINDLDRICTLLETWLVKLFENVWNECFFFEHSFEECRIKNLNKHTLLVLIHDNFCNPLINICAKWIDQSFLTK